MGASWLTTVFGVLTILGDVGAFISRYMGDNEAPITPEGYFAYFMGLATGIGLILAKSFNVSNSSHPKAATVVSPANEAKVNPAAEEPKP